MRAIFGEVEISVLKRLFDVNFWGAVHCTKYALPYLIDSKGHRGWNVIPGRYCGTSCTNRLFRIQICPAWIS